jgi:hypothetical protein
MSIALIASRSSCSRSFVLCSHDWFMFGSAAKPCGAVGQSRRRCGQVPAQMWASPGADVGQSRRRCGQSRRTSAPVPAQMCASHSASVAGVPGPQNGRHSASVHQHACYSVCRTDRREYVIVAQLVLPRERPEQNPIAFPWPHPQHLCAPGRQSRRSNVSTLVAVQCIDRDRDGGVPARSRSTCGGSATAARESSRCRLASPCAATRSRYTPCTRVRARARAAAAALQRDRTSPCPAA